MDTLPGSGARAEQRRKIRAVLARRGQTVRALARELGECEMAVHNVLHGRVRGLRGKSYRIAAALGLVDGVPATWAPLAEQPGGGQSDE